jgi:hypothetical protein
MSTLEWVGDLRVLRFWSDMVLMPVEPVCCVDEGGYFERVRMKRSMETKGRISKCTKGSASRHHCSTADHSLLPTSHLPTSPSSHIPNLSIHSTTTIGSQH